MSAPRCGRNHPMPSWEPVHCGRHPHRLYTCRARVGKVACGQQALVPELAPGCGTPEEAAR